MNELVRTLFPVESMNDKNENDSPQRYRRWIHSPMNTCRVSHLVSHSVSQSFHLKGIVIENDM